MADGVRDVVDVETFAVLEDLVEDVGGTLEMGLSATELFDAAAPGVADHGSSVNQNCPLWAARARVPANCWGAATSTDAGVLALSPPLLEAAPAKAVPWLLSTASTRRPEASELPGDNVMLAAAFELDVLELPPNQMTLTRSPGRTLSELANETGNITPTWPGANPCTS